MHWLYIWSATGAAVACALVIGGTGAYMAEWHGLLLVLLLPGARALGSSGTGAYMAV